MIGSLRVIATPEPMASLNVCASPSPSKADSKSDSRIPFLAAGDSEGDAWPQHLSMTKEAQEFVAQIDGPICVLVCMGQQGTDKSLLISRALYGEEAVPSREGSPVSNASFHSSRGGSRRRSGIALWPCAAKARASDGTEVNLLVLDVQDFDATDANKGRDECLFALGMLLSSFVVYHTHGGLTEERISKLWSFVSAANKNIQTVPTHERDRDEADMDFADLSPKLLWVLHGFSLTRDASGRQMKARQYLERALQESDASLPPGASLAQHSSAKATLRRVFTDRDCFALMQTACPDSCAPSNPSPTSSSSWAVLSADERSRAQVSALRDRIMHNAEMKFIGGAPINGRMLLTLTERYIAGINASLSLNVPDAWGAVADAECELCVQRCLAKYNASFESLRTTMPLSASELSLWQMNSTRDAIECFSEDSRHLQVGRAQRHRLRLEETLKGLWERVHADNCSVGEDKAQVLLTQLYEEVEQKLHADEYSDFSHYDRDRRRVRSEFLEKAPKQAAVLAVMYEFMESEVVRVAKRFVSRVSMNAINCESQKEEEAAELKLQVTDLNARLKSLDAALAESKARERRAREDMAAAQEQHAQEMLEIGQGRSKALRDLLANYEEAKRGKVEAELQLSHAVDKIEELTEWKNLNSSRAIWDAVEARAEQAREDDEVLQRDLAELLEVGDKNQRLLASETESICRTLLGADAQMAPVHSGVYDGQSWQRLQERCPELAKLGQTLADQQQDMLQRLKAVRAALDGGSVCPSCPPSEISIPTGAEKEGAQERCISIGLSPIDLVEYKSAHALAAQKRQLTTQQTSVEEQWFSPILVSNAVVNSRTCLPSDAEALKGGAGQGDTGSMGWQGKRSPVVVRSSQTSESKSAGLAPVVQCAEASKGHNSAAGTPAPSSEPSAPLVLPEHDGGGDREQAASNQPGRRLGVSEEVVAWESSAIKQKAPKTGAAGKGALHISQEIAWELPSQEPPAGSMRDADSVTPSPSTEQAQAPEYTHKARMPAPTPGTLRIEQAFHALQNGDRLPSARATPASAAAPRAFTPAANGHVPSHLFAPAAAEASSHLAQQPQHGAAARRLVDAQMAARNSSDERRRSSLLTRIEMLERSINESISVARTSPVPSVSSRATSGWDFVEGARLSNAVTACRVPRAVLQVEGMGRKYTAYEVEIALSGGQCFLLSKRYREFFRLHSSLLAMYPHVEMPVITAQLFPSRTKNWFRRFDPEFVECRRCWLDQYVSALLRHADLYKSKLLQTFLAATVEPVPAAAASTL